MVFQDILNYIYISKKIVLKAMNFGFFRDAESPDSLSWARSKNPECPKIPGIGIGILKALKNPECEIPKSRRSEFGFENPEKIPSEKFRKSHFKCRDFFKFRDFNTRD